MQGILVSPNISDLIYCKVASSRLSRLVAHSRIFRLFMKGNFDAYGPKLNSRPVYFSQLIRYMSKDPNICRWLIVSLWLTIRWLLLGLEKKDLYLIRKNNNNARQKLVEITQCAFLFFHFSTIKGAGDGVFLKKDAPKNTIVAFFNGIHITLDDTLR